VFDGLEGSVKVHSFDLRNPLYGLGKVQGGRKFFKCSNLEITMMVENAFTKMSTSLFIPNRHNLSSLFLWIELPSGGESGLGGDEFLVKEVRLEQMALNTFSELMTFPNASAS